MSKVHSLDFDLDRYSITARTVLDLKNPVKRLGELALYTAAAGSALALAPGAEASIIYSGPENITVQRLTSGVNGGFADLDDDGLTDMVFVINSKVTVSGESDVASVSGSYGRLLFFNNPKYGMSKFGASTRNISFKAGTNTSVNHRGTLRRHVVPASGPSSSVLGLWNPGPSASSAGFAGFALNTGTGTNVQPHFGWLHFKLATDANNRTDSLTLIDWAFQSVAGEGIHVGDKGVSVPEPSGLALMALGALGIAALRRRRSREKNDPNHAE